MSLTLHSADPISIALRRAGRAAATTRRGCRRALVEAAALAAGLVLASCSHSRKADMPNITTEPYVVSSGSPVFSCTVAKGEDPQACIDRLTDRIVAALNTRFTGRGKASGSGANSELGVAIRMTQGEGAGVYLYSASVALRVRSLNSDTTGAAATIVPRIFVEMARQNDNESWQRDVQDPQRNVVDLHQEVVDVLRNVAAQQ